MDSVRKRPFPLFGLCGGANYDKKGGSWTASGRPGGAIKSGDGTEVVNRPGEAESKGSVLILLPH